MSNVLRKCTMCGVEATSETELRLFMLGRASRYGRQNKCKRCQSSYQVGRRAKLQSVIDAARDVPCADCGQRFPAVCMDFDHLSALTKVDTVSALLRRGRRIDAIEAEIAKCDVVCANCHRVRTWRSGRAFPNTGSKGL